MARADFMWVKNRTEKVNLAMTTSLASGTETAVVQRRTLRLLFATQIVSGMGVAIGSQTKARSEEHTSELQSLRHLLYRLLLDKKKLSLAACYPVVSTRTPR